MKILLVILLLASPFSALCKCADSSYMVNGKIVLENGAPAKGAIVALSWVENAAPAAPVIATTNSSGKYRVLLPFSTYSGQNMRGDMCNGKLSKIAIRAYTSQLESFGFVREISISPSRTIDMGTVPVMFKRYSP